ncbi:Cyclic di-GMP phosphodiesterase response regulator RpfG [Caulifigura coniformis]|uniref:Cyclic di-GMP phosphodiesterase response regulator RpfG n=1 Tax=Caulifigura coniformis TaxID=2527983 RepID=A0A517SE02_9PLAN|nr:HD domain-containing phosphohydrolase [Caulifigura coniformis]QDT54356.1 Cyclic di-GMP phosphodiesterase response regulator RpfG [Caulifigura coniformis]
MSLAATPVRRPSLSRSSAVGRLSEISHARIAVIDDDLLNVRLIRRHMQMLGFENILGISDSVQALEQLVEFRPDVVLMDLIMPGLSGVELLTQLRAHPVLHDTPVITLTASDDRMIRLKILELGVSDFLSKPVDEMELSTRLRNVIEAKHYRDQLNHSAQSLERAVQRRIRELEASRREVVQCLARAAEYRDDHTGRHVLRVGRYTALLAAAMGMQDVVVEMIELAAQLHDVGKIGIPDQILHKPGRLDADEMTLMRKHADFGWNIIAPMAESDLQAGDDEENSQEGSSPMLMMAARIAASHHERWDGAGYPRGLAGRDIPLEARLTAVADVFDALSTPRCYKPALPLVQCFEILQSERGRHFDPAVIDACFAIRPQMEATFHELRDVEAVS